MMPLIADISNEKDRQTLGDNDAVLDWKIIRGAERPFTGITSLSDLLSLFSLIEAVAIYDVLWIANADVEFLDVLKPLVDMQVVRGSSTIPDQLSDPNIKENFTKVAHILRYGPMARLSEVGAVDQATEPTYARFLFAEKNNVDSVLDPVLTSYIPLVKEEGRKSLVSRLSNTLSRLYQEEINELVAMGVPVPFYIPPAPAVILDRSGGRQNQIVKELLELREEFARFRAKYRQYQKIIRNPSSYTLAELSKAVREGLYEVEIALEEVAKKGKRRGSRLMSEVFDVTIATSFDQISIDKSLGWLVKGLPNTIKAKVIRGRAQCLFDLWYAAMSIRGYDTLIQRYFDLEKSVFSYDLELVQKLSTWIDGQLGIKR
jgi:hypothetical protein